MAITHTFVCAIADDATAVANGEVVPGNWNADHTVTNLVLTHGTITTDVNTLGATVTWNNAAVTFTAQKINVTDTASASGSLLADWQVGGVSKVSIKKNGEIFPTYGNNTLTWKAADGKGFAFGFSEGAGADDNHIWNHGFNLGSVSDVAEPTLFVSMESNYDAGAANYMEYHLNYIPVGGSGALRPFSFDIDRDTDNIRARFSGEPITFSNSDGSRDPVILSFTGAAYAPVVLVDDEWTSGANHYGLRYILDNTAGGTGTLLGFEVDGASLLRFDNSGRLAIGPEAADQLLSISSASAVGLNIKTTASGTAVTTLTASGSTNIYVAANSTNGRWQLKMSGGLSPMIDVEGKAVRLGYDNYNGSTTASVWDNTSSTGVSTLAIRDGAGQSTADYLTVYTGGWTVKKASINPSGFYFYGTYTDSSNYVRASLASTSTTVTLAAETAGTGADNVDVTITPAGTGGVDIGAFYHQLSEMTAPAAPAANGCRIYAVDNGGGKTQLMALFSSGAAQQLAIQP